MKTNMVFAGAIFLICGLVAYAESSSAATSENQNINHLPLLPPPDDVSERQKWFLDYIQEIAAYPNLSDADASEKLLQSQFTTEHSEVHYENMCDDPNSHTSNSRVIAVDHYTSDKNSWFKAMPGGIQHMQLHGGGIFNPKPTNLDDPKARLYVSKITTCGGRKRVTPRVSVKISFENIPGFVCITQNQMQSSLPQVGRDNASDGYVEYSYKARLAEESGVSVSFSFPVFSTANECLVGVSIEQDERYSMRAERVSKEFRDCLNTKHVDVQDPACGGGIPELMNKD